MLRSFVVSKSINLMALKISSIKSSPGGELELIYNCVRLLDNRRQGATDLMSNFEVCQVVRERRPMASP